MGEGQLVVYVLQYVIHYITTATTIPLSHYKYNENSMDFEPSPSPPPQLVQLRNRLYKKHLLLSIPALIVLFLVMLAISIIVVQQYQPTKPQLILGDLLDTYLDKVMRYGRYFGVLAEGYAGPGVTSATTQPTYYKGMYTGFTCYVGSAEGCNSLRSLSAMAWQYQTSIHQQLTINQVLICSRSTSSCIGTSDTPALQPHQYTLITSLLTSQLLSSPYLEHIMGTLYLIYPHNKTITIVKMKTLYEVIMGIVGRLEIVDGMYYQVLVLEPFQQVVFEYGVKEVGKNINTKAIDAGMGLKLQVQSIRPFVSTSYLNKIPTLMCLILLIFILKTQKHNITRWILSNFSRKQLINRLYRYTIRDIFTGRKPSISNVLQRGPTSQLFQTLSQLMDKSIVEIEQEDRKNVRKEPFKFMAHVDGIIAKYQALVKGNMESKNKYILANRFNLQNYINDICEIDGRLLKQFYVRCQQLGILRDYFKFAYSAMLKSVEQFQQLVSIDPVPFPDKLMAFCQKINKNVHQPSTIYDKLDIFGQGLGLPEGSGSKDNESKEGSRLNTEQYIEQNKQELQFRVRVYIIPKYLMLLKELDSHNSYAEELGFQRELRSFGEIVENTRYLLTKHNKNVRNYCK